MVDILKSMEGLISEIIVHNTEFSTGEMCTEKTFSTFFLIIYF